MPTPAFCKLIRKEQLLIESRCDEIDETMRALDDERKAIEERSSALDGIWDLYLSSQETVDEALTVRTRLNVTIADMVTANQ